MIFNFWRPYPLLKPRKYGNYLCSTRDADNPCREQVLELWYDDNKNTWIDTRRQSVFEGYKVYKQCREPMEHNRVYTDSLCERLDVVAWKKLPRVYRFGKKNKEDFDIYE